MCNELGCGQHAPEAQIVANMRRGLSHCCAAFQTTAQELKAQQQRRTPKLIKPFLVVRTMPTSLASGLTSKPCCRQASLHTRLPRACSNTYKTRSVDVCLTSTSAPSSQPRLSFQVSPPRWLFELGQQLLWIASTYDPDADKTLKEQAKRHDAVRPCVLQLTTMY
jgi:hypothetical protein